MQISVVQGLAPYPTFATSSWALLSLLLSNSCLIPVEAEATSSGVFNAQAELSLGFPLG